MREQGKMLKAIKELYEANESKTITVICKSRERIQNLILQFQQFILENFEYEVNSDICSVRSTTDGSFELEFCNKYCKFITMNFVDLSYNKIDYIVDTFEIQEFKDEKYYNDDKFKDRFLECLGVDIKDK